MPGLGISGGRRKKHGLIVLTHAERGGDRLGRRSEARPTACSKQLQLASCPPLRPKLAQWIQRSSAAHWLLQGILQHSAAGLALGSRLLLVLAGVRKNRASSCLLGR